MDDDYKDFLMEQVNMYLGGMSFREIASKVGQSHVTVRDNITNKIKDISTGMYMQVQEKIANNSEKTINDSDIRNRVLASYKLLTEENKTISEIAEILDTTENVIYRDLTSRFDMLHEKYPELVTSIMQEKVKVVFQKHSLNNLVNISDDFYISAVEKIFPSVDKRFCFIVECALTFGIQLQKLCEIFGIDPNTFRKNLNTYAPKKYDSINRLFKHGMFIQEVSEKKCKEYIYKLYISYENRYNDMESAKEILNEVTDKKASEIREKIKSGKSLTDDEIIVLVKFQIKHLISSASMERLFGLERSSYSDRIVKLQDKYPDVVKYYKELCEVYKENFKKNLNNYNKSTYKEGR